MSDEVLDIFIDAGDDSPNQSGLLAEFTLLRKQISALPVIQVRSGVLDPGPGTKASNGVDITHLVVTLVPTATIIEGITRVCVARIKAGAARELHLKLGDNELRLTGVNAELQAEALQNWTQAVLNDGPSE